MLIVQYTSWDFDGIQMVGEGPHSKRGSKKSIRSIGARMVSSFYPVLRVSFTMYIYTRYTYMHA